MVENNYKDIVHVGLLGEGTVAHKAVPSKKISDSIFLLNGNDLYAPEDELWEFLPGTLVFAEKKTFPWGTYLCAVDFAEKDAQTATLYVPLLNVGYEEWRPVPAIKLDSSTYLLQGEDFYNPQYEHWQFLPGSKVKVEKQEVYTRGTCLVAISQVEGN